MASREAAIKNNLNDRARKVGQFDELTTQDIDALIAFYDFTCLYPGCDVKPATSVDHVKPLSKGGTNTFDNLQLLCVNHNKQKGDEEIDYRNGKIFTGEIEGKDDISPSSRNWEEIRLEYIHGQISYRKLAEKHNVSFSALQKHGIAEDWTQQRADYRYKTATELGQRLREQHIDAKTTAARVAYDVISSWLSPFGEPASASDALNAAKLLLLAEGEATDRVALHLERLERAIQTNGNDVGTIGSGEGSQPTSSWLRALADSSTDSPVA
jgi:hypothetical protein